MELRHDTDFQDVCKKIVRVFYKREKLFGARSVFTQCCTVCAGGRAVDRGDEPLVFAAQHFYLGLAVFQYCALAVFILFRHYAGGNPVYTGIEQTVVMEAQKRHFGLLGIYDELGIHLHRVLFQARPALGRDETCEKHHVKSNCEIMNLIDNIIHTKQIKENQLSALIKYYELIDIIK